ncbi:MAG TPA: hypothetical protein VMV46_20850 [Thermoanaerobaculia bacterium]|nr:hypothetical protein [Thermoanaerobaculia bacterium]
MRYARFERRDGVLELAEARAHPLPADLFQPGPLGGPARDPEALAGALAALLEGEQPEEASLLLPDRWLRLAFAEITELPRGDEGRAEAFRFKLRQLVPFRVDELRVEGFEVAPLAGQGEPRRVVLAFCVESLVRQLEHAFAARGVALGLVTGESLALHSLLDEPGLSVVLRESDDAYTLLVGAGSEPLLFRYKPLAGRDGTAVVRELRLTRSFLDERVPGRQIGRALVAAPDPAPWLECLREGLGVEAEPFSAAAIVGTTLRLDAGWSWSEGGPLLGVALQEVA